VAVIRAALLDAEFEQLVAVQMGAVSVGQTGTLGAALAAFRSRVITWNEADRAARPAGVKGVDAPVTEWSIGSELGRSLCAFAEQPDAMGRPLPLDLLARLTEALALGADTAGKSYGVVSGQLASALTGGEEATPVRTSLLGESARRAAVAEGRARFFERALLANDTDLAEEHLVRFETEEGMTFEPSVRQIVLRYALRVLAQVAREDARRERGCYPEADLDPLMAVPVLRGHPGAGLGEEPGLRDTGASTMPMAAGEQEKGPTPAPTNSVETATPTSFMEVSAAAIDRIEARTTEQVGAKQIRDYNVARRLFGEIFDDLKIDAITKEICQDFVAQLS
jgi:hypothetical protein